MEALSLFLLKSIIISGLLTAWYLLALRGRRLHQYNRFFLLSILFFSLSIPFLHFHLLSIPRAVSGRFAPVALLTRPVDLVTNSYAAPALIQSHTNWPAITAIIAAGICLALLIILSVRILKVLQMRRQHTIIRFNGANVIFTDSPKAPFSFLKYIFWNKSIPLQDEVGQVIFRHELAHIEQGHTYDKLSVQILTCIFWFNPFYWIIQKELNVVHEFVADESAIADRDTETFATMLLRSYSNGSFLVPQHHFFSSSVKRRLAMLQTTVAPSYAALRRFMAVPLIAGTILLFSFSVRNTASDDIVPAKKKIVLLLDAGHGGTDDGARSGVYSEKEICLLYATRIKELSSAYNVDVQLTRHDDANIKLSDRVVSQDNTPDVFISLHLGSEPGTEKGKGDFDIYVSGQNAHAAKSATYSNAIFQFMVRDNIIPGYQNIPTHTHSPGCNCSTCVAQAAMNRAKNAAMSSTEKEGIYVLTHVQAPAMVLVLGNVKNSSEMQQLMENTRLDMICKSILKGVVDGAVAPDDFTGTPFNLLSPDSAKAKCR